MEMDRISTDTVETPFTKLNNIRLSLLRLDKLHPVISGNKWFKLKYFLQEAKSGNYPAILTFGGAYSNHIAATAYAAKVYGFTSIGIIRGEEPEHYSHTLEEASKLEMQLVFCSRTEFARIKRNASTADLEKQFGPVLVIPEGGYGAQGVRGAAEILQTTGDSQYTHFVTAVGTGTTVAGILQATNNRHKVIGISVMKNNHSLAEEIQFLLGSPLPERFQLFHDYHFGGYAKHTSALFSFMNSFYTSTQIPLDFVYTAKMMYGIFELIKNGYFPPHAHILAVHSGGLQGNRSLPPDTLLF